MESTSESLGAVLRAFCPCGLVRQALKYILREVRIGADRVKMTLFLEGCRLSTRYYGMHIIVRNHQPSHHRTTTPHNTNNTCSTPTGCPAGLQVPVHPVGRAQQQPDLVATYDPLLLGILCELHI